ncbi:hypothetical protein ABZW50_14560 [Streptomyces bacillaris]
MLDRVPDPANSTPCTFGCDRSACASEGLDEPYRFARYSEATPERAIERIRDEALARLDELLEGELMEGVLPRGPRLLSAGRPRARRVFGSPAWTFRDRVGS